jgi:hypothetical protein
VTGSSPVGGSKKGENMEVTKDMIEQWKKEYVNVFRVIINEKAYYFRTLTRDDYMAIQEKVQVNGPAFDNELEVALTCLIEPKLDVAELKSLAGVVGVLSEKIMLRSGFQQVDDEQL